MFLLSIALLVICSLSCFFLGRRFPSRTAIEVALCKPPAPLPVPTEPEPEAEAELIVESVTDRPAPPPPRAPLSLDNIFRDENDEKEATAFFTALNADECDACSGGSGNCTCTDVCQAVGCSGWAGADSGEHIYSPETVDTKRLCDQMDRETEAYLMAMRAETARYRSGQSLGDAQRDYCEAVSHVGDADTAIMGVVVG
jgi:hypothetical protein